MNIRPFSYMFQSVWFVMRHIKGISVLIACVPLPFFALLWGLEYLEVLSDESVSSIVPSIMIDAVFLYLCAKYSMSIMSPYTHTFSIKQYLFAKKTWIRDKTQPKTKKRHPMNSVILKSLGLFVVFWLPVTLLGILLYEKGFVKPYLPRIGIIAVIFLCILIYVRLRFILVATCLEHTATIRHIWHISKGFQGAYFKFVCAIVVLFILWTIVNFILFAPILIIEPTWTETPWGFYGLVGIFIFIYYLFYAIFNHAYLLFYLDIKHIYDKKRGLGIGE